MLGEQATAPTDVAAPPLLSDPSGGVFFELTFAHAAFPRPDTHSTGAGVHDRCGTVACSEEKQLKQEKLAAKPD